MNKQYIKRQITLHKLGLPMDKEVKDYYDYFHSLININDLEELIYDIYPDSIFWRKDGEIILEYDIKGEHFWVEHYTIWKKFEEKYILSYKDIGELLGGLLEESLKLIVCTADFDSYREDYFWRKIDKYINQ